MYCAVKQKCIAIPSNWLVDYIQITKAVITRQEWLNTQEVLGHPNAASGDKLSVDLAAMPHAFRVTGETGFDGHARATAFCS